MNGKGLLLVWVQRIGCNSEIHYSFVHSFPSTNLAKRPTSLSVVSKATAADSDEATNLSSAVASDTTLRLRGNLEIRLGTRQHVLEPDFWPASFRVCSRA